MAHIVITLFFGAIFIGAGVAAQMLVRDHWGEIAAALAGRPLRRTAPAPRFTVTLRPGRGLPRARLGAAA